MLEESQQRLATGDRCTRHARWLLRQPDAEVVHEWAIVIAFNAAVQYVNAMLLARVGFVPRTHAEREAAIGMLREFRAVRRQYFALKEQSSRVRYSSGFQLPMDTIRLLVDTQLEAIRGVVLRLLPPDTRSQG